MVSEYTYDKTAFDNVDNEHAAYFLGFLYADGCNHEKKKAICLTQNIDDIDIIYKFRDFMKSNHEILFYQSKPGLFNKKKTAIMWMYSPILCQRLSQLGMIPNKTFKTTFPQFVSKEMKRHFVRGYFDGDGSISVNSKIGARSALVTMTGTKELLGGIETAISEETGLSGLNYYARHPERNHNITALFIQRKADMAIFLNWIYANVTIYLDRKYKFWCK